jgi:hypothetical protein
MFDLSLSKASESKKTVITNPVSVEQADGPKKVNPFRSGVMTALVTVPHKRVVSYLKFHPKMIKSSMLRHAKQNGKMILDLTVVS